jgi:hypothetical protein
MQSIIIRRLVDLLLAVAIGKTIGPVNSIWDCVDRFLNLGEVTQIGLITALVLIGSTAIEALKSAAGRLSQMKVAKIDVSGNNLPE